MNVDNATVEFSARRGHSPVRRRAGARTRGACAVPHLPARSAYRPPARARHRDGDRPERPARLRADGSRSGATRQPGLRQPGRVPGRRRAGQTGRRLGQLPARRGAGPAGPISPGTGDRRRRRGGAARRRGQFLGRRWRRLPAGLRGRQRPGRPSRGEHRARPGDRERLSRPPQRHPRPGRDPAFEARSSDPHRLRLEPARVDPRPGRHAAVPDPARLLGPASGAGRDRLQPPGGRMRGGGADPARGRRPA